MATWLEFKTFFPSDEQDYVQAFIDEIKDAEDITYFSEIYNIPEERIIQAINDLTLPSTLYNELGDFIYSKAAAIPLTGTDEEQWDQFILAFAGDYKLAIIELTNVLKSDTYNYSFQNFQSVGAGGALIRDIIGGQSPTWSFFSYWVKALLNRADQAIDGYVALENLLQSGEKEAIRPLLSFLQSLPKYEYFENLIAISQEELSQDLRTYIHYYETPRDLVDYLIEELSQNLSNSLHLSLSNEDIKRNFLLKYRVNKREAIDSLYSSLTNGGYISNIEDLSSFPLYTGISDDDNSCTSIFQWGFQLQKNFDFIQGTKGWYADTAGTEFSGSAEGVLILSSYTSKIFTDFIFTPGRNYKVEFDIVSSSDSSNTLVVSNSDDSIIYDTLTNPSPGLQSLEFQASTNQIKFSFTAGSGNIRIDKIQVYEKLVHTCSSVREIQAAGSGLSQIVHIYPYGKSVIGESFRLIHNTLNKLDYNGSGNYSTDLTNISDSINQLALDSESNWYNYSASVDNDHIVLTGVVDVPFSLNFASLKYSILELSANNDFFNFLAKDLKAFAVESLEKVTLERSVRIHLNRYGYDTDLADFRVVLEDLEARPSPIHLGDKVTDGTGRVEFKFNLIKPAFSIRNFRLYLYKGDLINHQDFSKNLDEPTEIVLNMHYFPVAEPASPSIDAIASSIGLTIPVELDTFLFNNAISTMEDIRTSGGLKQMEGLPVSQDHEAIVKLDAHAFLNAISSNVDSNNELINSGITSPFLLGLSTRSEIVQTQESSGVGSFNAASVFYVSKAYGNLLQNILTGHLSSSAINHTNGQIPELEPLFSEKCLCKDCNSAVSPLAYLTDLLNYTLLNVKNPSAITLDNLESYFFQNFKELPGSCDDVSEIVCQQRIAIEVLRNYIDSLELPSENQVRLEKDKQDYIFKSYLFLLKQLGSSYEKIREIRKAGFEEKKKYATQLGFPFSESFDPFSSDHLFLDPDGEYEENILEILFGIQDTSRNSFSTGVKENDSSGQISRWIFKNVKFKESTDLHGYIYSNIDAVNNEVLLYKSDNFSTETLIGKAIYSGVSGIYNIQQENETGLTGELHIVDMTDNSTIKFSVLPKVLCWKLEKLQENWFNSDWQVNPYKNNDLPVIDPDTIGPDDFRFADAGINDLFGIWSIRRTWVDNQLSAFDAIPDISNRLARMSDTIDYTHLDNTITSSVVWPTVPAIQDLKTIYLKLKQGSALEVEEAILAISGLYLTSESFNQLYNIYNKTFTNDSRGLIAKIQQSASGSVSQITNLLLGDLKVNDTFKIDKIENGTVVNTVSQNVESLTETDISNNITLGEKLLTALLTLIDADPSWNITSIELGVNKNSLIITSSTNISIKTSVFRYPSEEELKDISSILTQALKTGFKATWLLEEANESVELNSNDFWKPIEEPKEGEWPIMGTADPFIDPELVNRTSLSESVPALTARELYSQRRDVLLEIYNNVKNIRETDNLESAYEYAWDTGYLSTYPSLSELYFILINVNDFAASEAARTYISDTLYISEDNLRYIVDITDRNDSLNAEEVNQDEWSTLYSILTTALKKRLLYSNWKTEEAALSYWEIFKPSLPKWRSSSATRKQWVKSLEDVSRNPIIDPDFVRPDFLKTIDAGTAAFGLWDTRNNLITDLLNQIKTDREAQLSALEGLDYIINKYLSPTSNSQVLVDLLAEAEAGVNILPRLDQLNITYDALQFILTIRELLVAESTVLDEEWSSIYSILVQVQKERSYSEWLQEEELLKITLSPDYFVKSNYSRTSFINPAQARILSWRMSKDTARQWMDTLDARIVSITNVHNFITDIIEKSEEENLVAYRDAFVKATIIESEASFVEQGEKLTERLLIDFRNVCCQKTTRVAQAIEALQLLLFSIRNGQIYDDFPNIKIQSDTFDEEWKWIGSYATWRSAMFVNIYPENLLHPALRSNSSAAFNSLVSSLRDNSRLTPAAACAAASEYYDYFKNVLDIKVIAHGTGTSPANNLSSCGSGNGAFKELQFVFGLSQASNKIYYSILDGEETRNFSPTPWAILQPFEGIVLKQVIGVKKWQNNNQNFLLFFIWGQLEEEDKVFYAKFNLDKGYWISEAVEIDIPEEVIEEGDIEKSNSSKRFYGPIKNIKVNKSSEDDNSIILLAFQRGSDIHIEELGPSGNNIFESEISKELKVFNEYYFDELYDFIDGNLFFSKLERKESPKDIKGDFLYYNFYFNIPNTPTIKVQVKEFEFLDLGDVRFNIYNYTLMNGTRVSVSALYYVRHVEVFEDLIDPGISYKFGGGFNFGSIQIDKDKFKTNGSSSNYLGGFNWKSNSGNLYYLFFRNPTDNAIHYYKLNPVDLLPTEHSYESSTYYVSRFFNQKGENFLIEAGANINIKPVYRISTPGNTLNNLAVYPNKPTVKINYGLATPSSMHPVESSGLSLLKAQVKNSYNSNSHLPKTLFEVVEEAYYYVPVMVAMSLQAKGHFLQALDWYKLVYAFEKPETSNSGNNPRKIWHGLVMEEDLLNDYSRAQKWLNDPINPHAIADTRALSYTKFTILSIAKCLIEYADSEFTKDTAESVPRARTLYLTALELMEAEGLYSSETDCEREVEALIFTLLPEEEAEWPEWAATWLNIKSDLLKIETHTILTTTILAIEAVIATADSLSQKLSNIKDIVDDTLTHQEYFVDMGSVITSGLSISEGALMKLMSNPRIYDSIRMLIWSIRDNYQSAVSAVTGIQPNALTSDAVSLPWFSADANLEIELASGGEIEQISGNLPLGPYFVKNGAAYYNSNAPTSQQLQTLAAISNPIQVIKNYYKNDTSYVPRPNPNFCVPPNPVLKGISYTAEANLFKIRNCMNIAGMRRELMPYAAPTDQSSGMPVLGGDGIIFSTGGGATQASIYRFDVLVERAKQQVSMAQQLESTLLSLYEKSDAERYNLLKARQDLRLANSGVRLQNLRVKEAESNIVLSQLQQDKIFKSAEHFQGLLSRGLLGSENAALASLLTSTEFLTISAQLGIGATVAHGVAAATGIASMAQMNTAGAAMAAQSVATALSNTSGVMQTMASIQSTFSSLQSMMASFERRTEEWQYQLELAQQDILISNQELKIAGQRLQIVNQEREIAELQAENAIQVIDFLSNKFTNAELYDWMSGVLETAYSFFLNQATSVAKTAQNQLSFERQEAMPSFIKDDYWEAPSNSLNGSGGPDRRGLTASVRLLQDLTELDQYAFDTEKRKLQLTKTISLMRMAPTEFQKFREEGTMTFTTPMELFDRDFPGHYLRLIKKVKVTVLALAPPVDGIKATLRNPGISYVVNGNDFRKNYIMRQPDSISFTSTYNATGIFELNEISNKVNPFENIGVESTWELVMPKPANFFDYETIADVFLTFEYTALESSIYRNEVVESLSTSFEGDRPLSFKNVFADQWYDLSNPDNSGQDVTVTFKTSRRDFPANLSNLVLKSTILMFASEIDQMPAGSVTLGFKKSSEDDFEYGETAADKILISGANAPTWDALVGKSLAEDCDWSLTLTRNIIDGIINETITDIILNLTIKGYTPEWPSY